MADLQPGRYRLERKLGTGSFGDTWLAKDTLLDRYVAVKRPKATHDPRRRERFLTEARFLARLNHPNITQIYDVLPDQAQDCFHIVIEYVDGKTVAEILERGSIPLDDILLIVKGVLEALCYAHERGVVHRDVKPQNVMIGDDVKLTDFGLAGLKSILERGTRTFAGTPAYMAPEQIEGCPMDGRADLYAVGVMLYEMIAGGRRPFEFADESEMLEAHLHTPPPPLTRFAPTVPPALEQVVMRLLTKAPEDRYPSAEAVIVALDTVCAGARVSNLPVPLTPLVGREAEMAAIGERLHDLGCRLLTLIGPGGIGKTRLAVEAAHVQADAFADGVFFVDLAPLQSADAIVPTVAQALGFSFFEEVAPRQQLLNYLRQKNVLLVMDNFEHLLAGVDLLPEMLGAAPDAQVLATSRERLGVQGEHLYPVTGMQVPDAACAEEASQYSAVRLFLSGARRMRADLQLTPDIRDDVVRICTLVGGLPLGILLAASWVEMLTPHEIAAEIGQGLDLLEADLRDVPERQRSMRAVFDHSWHLLTEREQEAFQGLSVFRGGFTRQAARQVAGASLRELMSLVQKSMLQRTPSGRYEVHGLLRQYAAERLAQAPEVRQAVHDRHCAYYAALLERWHTSLQGAQWQAALTGMDEEIENARAAWDWAAERGQVERLGQAVDGLRGFYMWRARYQEGERACRKAMEGLATAACDGEPVVLAKVLAWLGDIQLIGGEYEKVLQGYDRARAILASRLDDSDENKRQFADLCRGTAEVLERRSEYDAALEWLAKALALVDEKQPTIEAARVYITQAEVHCSRGDYEKAIARCRMGLATAEAVSGREGRQIAARAYGLLGGLYTGLGELHQAVRFCRESLRVRHHLDDIAGQAYAHINLANALFELGNWSRSVEYYLRALDITQDIGDVWHQAAIALNLGNICAATGDLAQAAVYNQQSMEMWQELGSEYAVALLHNNMAAAALRGGEPDRARSLLETSLGMFEQIGSTQFLPEVYRNMAGTYLVQGRLDDARACAERSLSLAQEQEARLEEGRTFCALGQVHLACGERAAAGMALRQSLAILTELNSVYELAKTRTVVARLAAETGRTDEARTYVAQAIETFERLGAQADLAEARALAGQL